MKQMKFRKLGHTGLDVSEISFGTWQIGGKRWIGMNDEKSIELLQKARRLGINLYDAAVVYGQYTDEEGNLQSRSQELLGKAFSNNREKVIYCIKIGQFDEYTHRADFDPKRLIYQLQQSMRRLGTDYIDICLIHAPSLQAVKEQKAISVLQTLQALGIVRAIGYSFENEPGHVLEAIKQPIDVIMLAYNLLDKECEEAIKKAEENGIGILVGGPLKRGYLTGEFQFLDDLPDDDYWKWNLRYNSQKIEQILEKVKLLLRKYGNPRQLRKTAIQSILSHHGVCSIVIGHRHLEEITENISYL